MAEDLNDYFSTDFNNCNYNKFMNKKGFDPYNNKKKLYQFGYNLSKYNCVITKRNFKTYKKIFRK